MTVVSVKVLYGTKHIKTIDRPLHKMNDAGYVKYKGQLYVLQKGDFIQVNSSSRHATASLIPPLSTSAPADGEPRYKDSAEISWDSEQIAVIEEAPGTRLLVDAGPGMGKTAVACARVAWLIDHAGLDSNEIWMISFTRTAVHEMRNRIAAYLKDPTLAAGIRIATIDSHCWAIQSGFDANADLSGGYEENIKKTIELIEQNEGVFEYFSQVKHLFIDEAQDVLGARVRLLLEMINALSREAGVTVLSDEAQSIYTFSAGKNPDEIKGNLPDAIREYMAENFYEIQLQNVHRTSDPTLCAVLSKGRDLLVGARKRPERKLEDMQKLILERNHGYVGNYRDDLSNLPSGLDNAFLLFRRRGEALQASNCLGNRPHRVRMSGLPPMLHDWIALLFWDWTASEMSGAEFSTRWAARVVRSLPSEDEAWKTLVRVVGITSQRISVKKLVQRLASGAPPVDLCLPDFGTDGPVIGTIHGAKGREADHVRLYVPSSMFGRANTDPNDLLEEARILFVGASRAKEQLKVGKGASKAIPRRLATSGRAFTPYLFSKGDNPSARAMVEVGRMHDIVCQGLTGKTFFRSQDDALAAQSKVESLSGTLVPLKATAIQSATHGGFGICDQEGDRNPYAFLSPHLNRDLLDIAHIVNDSVRLGRLGLPNQISHLKSFGVRTLAVSPEDPLRGTLHAPWRDSGLMLAPLVLGYGMTYFRY